MEGPWRYQVENFVEQNPRVIEAWLDDIFHPTEFFIRHLKTFSLHHCKMSQDLAKLKITLYGPDAQVPKH